MAKESQPGKLHLRIVEVMKRFPEGISCDQIRHELEREGIPAEDIGHRPPHKRIGQVVHHRENDDYADR